MSKPDPGKLSARTGAPNIRQSLLMRETALFCSQSCFCPRVCRGDPNGRKR